MLINIITLFPEMFASVLSASILGRGLSRGIWSFNLINLRNFGDGDRKNVDDDICGGGVGRLLRPDILDKAIEYVTLNGIMSGTSDTTFSPDAVLTKDELSKALNNITGDYDITDNNAEVSKFNMAFNVFKAAEKKGLINFINVVKFTFNIITTNEYKITRAVAADILYSYIKTFA